MWPVVAALARTYAPYLLFPVTATIGFFGYMYESNFRQINVPFKSTTIQEERDQRKLEEVKEQTDLTNLKSLKSKPNVPTSILDRNDKSNITKGTPVQDTS
ncbi:Small integral membrane protein 12-A [Mizuhopecten yessoensis]|uniref:Small integral membrane protein 12-A n=1 Tax=Mizuhopecten yessoensis TaxID=6573 RepID=A0A210PM59_MIZYE|nr:Small integral membrane protein 12-A [Mizuhopecten yessoensis]